MIQHQEGGKMLQDQESVDLMSWIIVEYFIEQPTIIQHQEGGKMLQDQEGVDRMRWECDMSVGLLLNCSLSN